MKNHYKTLSGWRKALAVGMGGLVALAGSAGPGGLSGCAKPEYVKIYRNLIGVNVQIVEHNGIKRAYLENLTTGEIYNITPEFHGEKGGFKIHSGGRIEDNYYVGYPSLPEDDKYEVTIIDNNNNAMIDSERSD